MTDDINDVRHTSTLAKFEEAVRRSSPVSTSADDLLERLDDQGLYCKAERIQMIKDAAAEIRRLRGLAQSSQQPEGAEEARKALQSLEYWCTDARMGLGAVDGYDYRSGEEYGVRRVEIEIHKRLTALSDSSTEGKSHD